MPDWVVLVCAVLAVFLAARILRTLHRVDGHNIEHVNRLARNVKAKICEESTEIKEKIMSAAQDAVDAVVAQLDKAKGEILAQIADLESREPDVDLSALKAAAQALDDVNPDPVIEEPVEEPEVPAEEPAE